MLDRQGLYDAAYESVASAKAVWSRIAAGIPFDRRAYQDSIERNTQAFSEATVAGWNASWIAACSRPAPVFFVGLPRSGTTLAEQVLSQHPAVITSDEKPFLQQVIDAVPSLLDTSLAFPDSVISGSDQDLVRLRDAYWEAVEADMGTLEDGVVLVDKLPLNLVDLGFIARVFPDAPVLVAIRDPRDVCLSCFMQGFQLNPATINFLDMEATVSLPEDAARFHVAARERLINTPNYQDVTTPIYSRSTERWKNYAKHISPYAARLEPFLQEFGYT